MDKWEEKSELLTLNKVTPHGPQPRLTLDTSLELNLSGQREGGRQLWGPEVSWDSLSWLFQHMDYFKNHKLRTWQIVPEQEGKVIAFSKVRGGMGIEYITTNMWYVLRMIWKIKYKEKWRRDFSNDRAVERAMGEVVTERGVRQQGRVGQSAKFVKRKTLMLCIVWKMTCFPSPDGSFLEFYLHLLTEQTLLGSCY